ncbi:hypothetical protein CF336_g4334 [Tilletia laevis]|uniref:Uncharacterized protein n=1 Tax=Tilletia caries TaxID=13290 RepID=A0A177T1A1_9BASI|nr:hypothetical protein CF335_g8804 [Tilletia laevis]KAE8192662.1 hypothetical protein CF336_g4334 [Tilletia laevis]KAE8259813.1 hypothetical protein A4X03_0g3981 [Tilletia caries]
MHRAQRRAPVLHAHTANASIRTRPLDICDLSKLSSSSMLKYAAPRVLVASIFQTTAGAVLGGTRDGTWSSSAAARPRLRSSIDSACQQRAAGLQHETHVSSPSSRRADAHWRGLLMTR